MILAMDRGDFTLADRGAINDREIKLASPMHYSMDCSSGISTSGGRDIELIPQMPCWVASVQKTECCAIFGPPKISVFVPRERVSNIPTVIFHGTLDGLCDDSRYADLIKLVDLSQ